MRRACVFLFLVFLTPLVLLGPKQDLVKGPSLTCPYRVCVYLSSPGVTLNALE